ncbi:PPC domain-containing protein [Candidatus Bipolaricaulota bacterium]|nr:PPC domain-containing protein [Candidatus Bipolaricaulota bacterium]
MKRWCAEVLLMGLWVILVVGVGSAAEFADQPDDLTSYIYSADDQVIYDDEFPAWIGPLVPGAGAPGTDLIVIFTQCHGGGMLDELAETVGTAGRVALFSAASYAESAWSASPFDSPGCLRGCGLKQAESYYVAAMAAALSSAGSSAPTMVELARWLEQNDEAAPGGAATDPAVCPDADLVTEPEHPQALFRNGGGGIRLGYDADGGLVPAEDRWAVLFVGDAYEVWASNDLERFYAVLRVNGFLDENIFVLAGVDLATEESLSGDQPLLEFPDYVDRPATRSALREALAEVAAGMAGASSQSQFVFWTTGHGNQEDRLPWDAAPVLAAGEAIQGTLSFEDPQLSDETSADLYRFIGQAGTTVQASLRSDEFDAYLFLYDSQRQVVETSDDEGGGSDSWMSVVLPEDGWYYVLANSYEPARGAYTLLVETPAAGIAGKPSAATAGTGDQQLALGVPLVATLESGDRMASDGSLYDAYRVSLTDADVYTLALASERFDAFLWVYDPLGALTAASDDVDGSDALMLLFPPMAGTYRIEASSFSPGETGEYTLIVSAGIDADALGARLLEVGERAQGVLGSKDLLWSDGAYYDLYQIAAAAGDRVSVRLTSSKVDAYLFVVDERGQWIAEDDDSAGGTNAVATFVAPADGLYTVIASSFSPGEQGSYTLETSSIGTGEPPRQAKPPIPSSLP